MEKLVFKNGIVWKGSIREITTEIKRLSITYHRLADLIQAYLH